MSVVPDSDARWRASVPTARRGRKHARARVLPGQRLTAGYLAGVFLGGVHACFMMIKVLFRGFSSFFAGCRGCFGRMIPGTVMVRELAVGNVRVTRCFMV